MPLVDFTSEYKVQIPSLGSWEHLSMSVMAANQLAEAVAAQRWAEHLPAQRWVEGLNKF